RMARAGVAAARIDLLEDHARRRQPKPCAAVLLRDERREPAVLRERVDELVRVAVGLERAPVLAWKALAERAHGRADLADLGRQRKIHPATPGAARAAAARSRAAGSRSSPRRSAAAAHRGSSARAGTQASSRSRRGSASRRARSPALPRSRST